MKFTLIFVKPRNQRWWPGEGGAVFELAEVRVAETTVAARSTASVRVLESMALVRGMK